MKSDIGLGHSRTVTDFGGVGGDFSKLRTKSLKDLLGKQKSSMVVQTKDFQNVMEKIQLRKTYFKGAEQISMASKFGSIGYSEDEFQELIKLKVPIPDSAR